MHLIHSVYLPLLPNQSTESRASKLQMVQGEENFPWSGTESSVIRPFELGVRIFHYSFNWDIQKRVKKSERKHWIIFCDIEQNIFFGFAVFFSKIQFGKRRKSAPHRQHMTIIQLVINKKLKQSWSYLKDVIFELKAKTVDSCHYSEKKSVWKESQTSKFQTFSILERFWVHASSTETFFRFQLSTFFN